MKKFSFTLILFALFTSCSFNSLFLHPTKLQTQSSSIVIAADTFWVSFNSETYQPIFAKNGKDSSDLGYSIESVIFESSNGNKLNGWVLKPKNISPVATLLHFHGNAGNVLRQHRAISPLINYGFQIFTFDYSGFGFSQGKATIENVLLDAHSALTYVKNRPDLQNTKLVIYGQSLGGNLAAVVASQRQNEIDGLVVEAAFSSHKDIAASRAGIFGRIMVKESYSSSDSIVNFFKPTLFIHSKSDKVVPYELGKKIYASANEPKQFLTIDREHIRGPKLYSDSISQKILFMLKNEK